jgi:hypothetical protein
MGVVGMKSLIVVQTRDHSAFGVAIRKTLKSVENCGAETGRGSGIERDMLTQDGVVIDMAGEAMVKV